MEAPNMRNDRLSEHSRPAHGQIRKVCSLLHDSHDGGEPVDEISLRGVAKRTLAPCQSVPGRGRGRFLHCPKQEHSKGRLRDMTWAPWQRTEMEQNAASDSAATYRTGLPLPWASS